VELISRSVGGGLQLDGTRNQIERGLLRAAAESCFQICQYLLNEYEALRATTANLSAVKASAPPSLLSEFRSSD
jgi:hypothetical protein